MKIHGKLLKFSIGVGGIYASYMIYGLVQEKLFKKEYPSIDGKSQDKFRHSFLLLFTQCFFSVILAFIVNKVNQAKTQISFQEKFIMGFFNFVSMIGSNTALGYMSYPLQALFKSCKVLSVLIVGLIFGKVDYPLNQYICGVVVTIGIILFNLCDDMKSGKETQFVGIALILTSLFCDGMLAEKQAEMRKKQNPSSFELMEICSFWCAVLSLAYGAVSGSLITCINFILTHNDILFDVLTIGFLGCIGQVFIFFTIRHFGPVILALVTTTRKFFTVLASIAYFGHNLFFGQWVGVSLVLLGVSYELYEGYKKNSQHNKQKAEQAASHKELPVKENNSETQPLKQNKSSNQQNGKNSNEVDKKHQKQN
ncbi:UAA transporter family protein (macronuclear) [Tetrahymena thermophila SB210]|uniref:UAA transporter family protein n=1 Tax=Tetrahymena thermophila (strain SB210) TaxID=312017 RepID=I7MIN0_TETTS|nr:UAA transporter family protein [Tetrahymena thermophila SB210]EAS04592.1 UAA transporter family protein [Tetrahymena thermophila SB210]|eukprot:XP_001024837.1 UAA transporter family protein [Tetrahymena thermophila SB210]